LQDLILGAPDRAQLVLRPAALEGGDDLVLAAAFIGPAEGAEIGFEHVDRSARVSLKLELIHIHADFQSRFVPVESARAGQKAQASADGKVNKAVDSADCHTAGRERPFFAEGFAAASGARPSSASRRAFSASFSSRAATAMAFTASNSSRETRSRPPIHSRARSCTAAWTSRVMPATMRNFQSAKIRPIVQTIIAAIRDRPSVTLCIPKKTGDQAKFRTSPRPNRMSARSRFCAPLAWRSMASDKPIRM